MNHFLNKFFLFVAFFLPAFLSAQEGVKTPAVANKVTGKVMLVAFEPKMYMSDVDQSINKASKLSFDQIREYFRHQLDTQLKLKLQSTHGNIVTFYSDSAKMAKDLDYVYNNTSLSYDPVDKPTEPTTPATKKNPNIQNGQLTVEINNDKKFMNTKILNTEVLSYLTNKYKSEYFVFINEFDMKTNPDSYDIKTDSYQREITVHYTIMDKNGKLIAAGIATSSYSSKINDPKKIAAQCFPAIATSIAAKCNAITNQK